MAKGSSTIKREWLDGEQACSRCGRVLKNIDKEVGTVRTLYPSRKREVLCYSCQRELLGLEPYS